MACLLAASTASLAQSFPFPRSADPRLAYVSTVKPEGGQAQLDRATIDFYEKWRAKFLQSITHGDVATIAVGEDQAFVNTNAGDPDVLEIKFRSVSEGHGYGMLIAALMAGHPRAAGVPVDRERRDFDALYRFFRQHSSVPDPEDLKTRHRNLMAFQVQGRTLAALVNSQPDDESDSASDGDMDIAYALLLAERQWGHDGPIKYGEEARKVIHEIEEHDINRKAATVKLGDAVTEGDEGDSREEKEKNRFFAVRTSDFMPQHWRAFARVGNRALWERVLVQSVAIEAAAFANHAPKTGLMPDFLTLPRGAKPDFGNYRPPVGCFQEREQGDGNWSYNACRTPWRLATDCLVNGSGTAQQQLETLNSFMQAQARREGGVGKLNAGYTLAGDKLPEEPDDCETHKGKRGKPAFEPAGSCFLAPLAVSAMLPGNREWLNTLWSHLMAAGDETYFHSSVKLLCMITISGNWWDPTSAKLP